ncbi:MAG: hypothetical protein JRJ42_05245 [Deltaproteobacteria bacterium]|nr:hypothetical protein [Deltaproteobacteria bacterium]MBW2019954.1 hypothetical protein [Deltaproteobacteria bacterium]MBW2074784.1 hypothetical protein [Deltaproteobacteria bacterium]RLB82861.1 MAG: hypothetical protein DRH17_04330 [Deltaproteobacteria bacterium]
MEYIVDAFNAFFDLLYNNLLAPFLYWIAAFLNLLISPLSAYPPRTQIIVVSVFGAIVSRILAKRFRAKQEKRLLQEFKERLSTLEYTKYIEDDKLRRGFRKGINESADEVYEKIILDKFFEMGISYLFPLFFFLIWLQYSLFTPENLKSLTGSPYVWVTDSGLKLSAAWVYLYFYNILLFGLWILEVIVRVVLKWPKVKKRNSLAI